MSVTRLLGRALVPLLALASAGMAQSRPLPEARICDMSFRVLMMHLVDSTGAPVSNAGLTVRRVRTRTLVERTEAIGSGGEYKVMEDNALPDLRRTGEAFDVQFSRGDRTKRVRVRIGTDAAGCHVRFIVDPKPVIF
jgi:hypothetical protein